MAPRLLLTLVTLMAISFAGCTDAGDNDSMDDMPENGNDNATVEKDPIEVQATVNFNGFYTPGTSQGNTYTTTLNAQSGSMLTVTFNNNDQNAATNHDWYLEALDVGTEVIGAGESDSVTFLVDLEPGQYAYYCTVPGHRGNGMEGTLTVTAA